MLSKLHKEYVEDIKESLLKFLENIEDTYAASEEEILDILLKTASSYSSSIVEDRKEKEESRKLPPLRSPSRPTYAKPPVKSWFNADRGMYSYSLILAVDDVMGQPSCSYTCGKTVKADSLEEAIKKWRILTKNTKGYWEVLCYATTDPKVRVSTLI